MTTQFNQQDVNHQASRHTEMAETLKQRARNVVTEFDSAFAANPSAMTKAAVEVAQAWERGVTSVVVEEMTDMADAMRKAAAGQSYADETNADYMNKLVADMGIKL